MTAVHPVVQRWGAVDGHAQVGDAGPRHVGHRRSAQTTTAGEQARSDASVPQCLDQLEPVGAEVRLATHELRFPDAQAGQAVHKRVDRIEIVSSQ